MLAEHDPINEQSYKRYGKKPEHKGGSGIGDDDDSRQSHKEEGVIDDWHDGPFRKIRLQGDRLATSIARGTGLHRQ